MRIVQVAVEGGALSDHELARLLRDQLGLDLGPALASAGPPRRTEPSFGKAGERAGDLSLDAFVERCREQLKLEEAAETAQAEEAIASAGGQGAKARDG